MRKSDVGACPNKSGCIRRPRAIYTAFVTKRLVDIDDTALEAAREALSTRTIKDTVNAALRDAAASAARRGLLERFRADGLPDLRDEAVMQSAWR